MAFGGIFYNSFTSFLSCYSNVSGLNNLQTETGDIYVETSYNVNVVCLRSVCLLAMHFSFQRPQ